MDVQVKPCKTFTSRIHNRASIQSRDSPSTPAPLELTHVWAVPYLVFCISKPAAPKSNGIHVWPRTRITACKFQRALLSNLITLMHYFLIKEKNQTFNFFSKPHKIQIIVFSVKVETRSFYILLAVLELTM